MDEIKQLMIKNLEIAIDYLGHAMNAVECDNDYNNGQNEEINKLYDSIAEPWKKLNELLESEKSEMKYNISNLDKFKSVAQDIPTGIYNKIAESTQKLIEDKIKELISPYIGVKNDHMTDHDLKVIKCLLRSDGYYLNHIIQDGCEYEEYNIQSDFSGKKDYFLVKAGIKQEENQYTAKTYISDIVRNIK